MYYCEDCNLGLGRDVAQKNFCFACDCCKTCCACNRPENFTNKLKFFIPTRNQKKTNKSSRFISAEIEVAGIKKNRRLVESVVSKWRGNIVYDGTLPAAGFEINTAPAGGDLYIRQITEICDSLAEAGAKVDERCGLHVHIDARDFNYNDLYRLIKIYAAIEPTLYSMTPSHRHRSEYAIGCGNYLDAHIAGGREKISHIELKRAIVTAIYTIGNSGYRVHKRGAGPGTGRYFALNLHSWFYRGTIECRLFDGTIDKNEIIDWGILWANILDFAARMSDDEVSAAMNKDKSYESLIHIVKGNSELESFIERRYEKYKPKKKKRAVTSSRSLNQ